jgi:uncharacterized membrane protein
MPLTLSLTGIVFILAGLFLVFAPPGKRNLIVGYRTSRSLNSQEAWDFSQRYSGKIIIKCGIVVVLMGLISWILPKPLHWIELTLTLAIILIASITPIIITERKLKEKYPKENSKS